MGHADNFTLDIGALLLPDAFARFRVWAPLAGSVDLVLLDRDRPPVPLSAEEYGYFSAVVDGIEAGACYWYLLDGVLRRPDPASPGMFSNII